MVQAVATREMVLGVTGEFCYIGFQPPLREEEIRDLVIPIGFCGDSFRPYVQEEFDGSMTLGYDTENFLECTNKSITDPENSLFVQYAQQVAERLGNISLDTTVHILGEGSLFDPRNRQI